MKKLKQTVNTILTIPDLDDISVKEARKIFLSYKEKATITDGYFDDSIWYLTDEYATYSFNFELDPNDYHDFLYALGIDFQTYVNNLKAYCAFKLGDLALTTIRDFIAQLKHLIIHFNIETSSLLDDYVYDTINQICEFFSVIHCTSTVVQDGLLETLEIVQDEMRKNNKVNQRELASLDSYMRFNEIIEDFWSTCTDKSKQLFYFPLYLWWRITAIIPTRPREFVLTPRNCLKKRGSKWELTLMKDTLKGAHKKVGYKIVEDYKPLHIQVSDNIAQLILWYKEETKLSDNNELKTLFIADTHYAKWERCRPYTSRYFTYRNLSTCLRYFFEQIIIERYGYHVVYERGNSFLADNEINYIYLGDTRHLALINMLMEGTPIMTAQVLANHESPTISAHYSSNIYQWVECKAYRQYRKLLHSKKNSLITKAYKPLYAKEFIKLDKNKLCYSPKVAKGNFEDCYRVSGENNLIGDCTNCVYYRKSGESFNEMEVRLKSRLNNQIDILKDVVEAVRHKNGSTETILVEIMKLRTEGLAYEQYLIEKNLMQEKVKKEEM